MTDDLVKNIFYRCDDREHFLLEMASGHDFSDISAFVDQVFPPGAADDFDLLLYKGQKLALRGSTLIAFEKEGCIVFPSFGIEVWADAAPIRTLIRHHITSMQAMSAAWGGFTREMAHVRAAACKAVRDMDAGLSVCFDSQHNAYVLKGPHVIATANIINSAQIPFVVDMARENLKAGLILPVDVPEEEIAPLPPLRQFHFPRDAHFIDAYRIASQTQIDPDEIPF
ncbi:hypothetical protein LV564_07750 [Komagataeibacter nataicola]|nr:hypothetical protein [Komagataeibacter nataicola]WEQ56942.1 hypothetical protein LV564_07750 [Komagataeibacter nataicola]WNM08473.1 hypothetical protein RI056_16770 [Komagataeibacter nataicola]GBR20635.1 hypothetical protein AA0616_1838 [Komagataeibacter nataicola NRIC 0616]